VVEDVEELGAEVQFEPFGDAETTAQCKVNLVNSVRAVKAVSILERG